MARSTKLGKDVVGSEQATADAAKVAADKEQGVIAAAYAASQKRFDTAFNISAKFVVTAKTGNAANIVKIVNVAWNEKLFQPQRVHDYCMGVGEFSESAGRTKFKKEFCNKHSPHYGALSIAEAQTTDDGKKLASGDEVAVTGVEGRMTVTAIGNGLRAIEAMTVTLIKCIAAIGNLDGNVAKVNIRQNGELAVTFTADDKGNVDQQHFHASALASKAPKQPANTRGKQLETTMSMPIDVVADTLRKMLEGIELDGLTQGQREKLSMLMAVMLNKQIQGTDDSGRVVGYTLAA